SPWTSPMNTRVACALVLLSVAGAGRALADVPPRPLPPQTGIPAVRNFDPNDYRGGQQNFAVAEDARGVLYVGNADGVLEYDGVRWHLIPTANRTAVRSLAVDAGGRIWVGGQGEIGYLAPDDSGAMHYVSITDRVPAEDRGFEDVWRTFATPRGVYFATYAALIRVDGDSVRVWRPHTEFRLAFLAGDRLFVKDVERGLVELANDELVAVPGG